MNVKIKLRIGLYENYFNVSDNLEKSMYYVKIAVLDIDDRFQVNSENGEYVRFRGENFYVKCNKNKPFGGLHDEGIIIPSLDKCGFAYTKYFDTDKKRKQYLKTLYITLQDWSNYWWGFEKDSLSETTIKDDIWEISCEKIEKVIYSVY